jgi:hypothetical protein
MGGEIPNIIRRRVIKQWLHGFPRDQIAKGNQIGAGTVSTIIKQCKEQKQQVYELDRLTDAYHHAWDRNF